jgi:hypothetical protein
LYIFSADATNSSSVKFIVINSLIVIILSVDIICCIGR